MSRAGTIRVTSLTLAWALATASAPALAQEAQRCARALGDYVALAEYFRARTSPRDDRYPVDADAIRLSYDMSFAPLLGDRTFGQWLADRRAAGRSTHVIDFFGSGVFLGSELDAVDSVTGARLDRKIQPGMARGYPNDKWRELPGNLYQRETWDALDTDMHGRNIPAYDLVVCRPIGAISTLPAQITDPVRRTTYLAAHHTLINRAWQRLSRDDGTMLLEIPYTVTKTWEFKRWLRALERAGIEHTYHAQDILDMDARSEMEREYTSHGILLRRTRTSPDRLPAL